MTALAIGGKGGNAIGSFMSGGNGGPAIVLPVGGAFGDSGTVTATQVGGAGGDGSGSVFALAGNGADSFVTDIVSGNASQNLSLNQYAYGGNGGGSDGAMGGTAGNASSDLTYHHPSPNAITTGLSQAVGGIGGLGSGISIMAETAAPPPAPSI